MQLAALYGRNEFGRYVWPTKSIHPAATDVHNITVDEQCKVMYARGRPVHYVHQRTAMMDFVRFVEHVPGSVVLVAHNGRRFDFPRFDVWSIFAPRAYATAMTSVCLSVCNIGT